MIKRALYDEHVIQSTAYILLQPNVIPSCCLCTLGAESLFLSACPAPECLSMLQCLPKRPRVRPGCESLRQSNGRADLVAGSQHRRLAFLRAAVFGCALSVQSVVSFYCYVFVLLYFSILFLTQFGDRGYLSSVLLHQPHSCYFMSPLHEPACKHEKDEQSYTIATNSFLVH